MLFPLSESRFFALDLFGKPFPQGFLFLFELGVVELLDLWFSEFASLHLLLPVVFVMGFFGSRNEVEHVGSDKEGTKLFEVTVCLVFNLDNDEQKKKKAKECIRTFGNTPEIFTSFDNSAVSSLYVLSRTDDRERDRLGEYPCVVRALVIGLYRRTVDTDALSLNNIANLGRKMYEIRNGEKKAATSTHTLLEQEQVILRQSIGLCNDRNQVDSSSKALHDLDIERLEALTTCQESQQSLVTKLLTCVQWDG